MRFGNEFGARMGGSRHGHGGCGEGMRHGMHGGMRRGMERGLGRGGMGRGGMGGGRRGRVFDSGELRLVLLQLIAEQPRHGYDLIKAIEERTGGGYAPSPGVIYPTLTLLEEMGLIDEVHSEGAKKRFAITAEGEAHLAQNAEQTAALFAKLDGMAENAAKTDSKSIRRALGNFRQALHDRLSEEDLSEEIKLQVVAIIDEAAQKIERVK